MVDERMGIEKFNIEDIFSMVTAKRGDHRGFFSETYNKDALAAEGVTANFVQDNHVYSAKRGVLLGCISKSHRVPRASSYVARVELSGMSMSIFAVVPRHLESTLG
jgi:dTDP-4-dehydrorhamnose 3,5-epimerase-like enzyme